MVTRKLFTCVLSLAAASTGLLAGQRATAAEEIVVDGTQAAKLAAAEREYFRAEISEFVRSFSSELKGTLSKESKELQAPTLVLAESETRIRG